MANIHVYPDKLPCDTGGSFVVVLSKALPVNVTEFSLIFEGISSKNRISGKAVPVDTKTLIGTVGGYGKPEEVSVEVVGTKGGTRVPSFSMTFLSRFQLISSFFPDDILLQAPVAVARCLPIYAEDIQGVDEELAEFCQRNMPVDLSFRHFFGSDLDEKMGSKGTLLHFAAENGLAHFAAHLLAASGGAWEALHTQNKEGLTPAEVAYQKQDNEIQQLFADFEDVAADNAVPLVEYGNLQELMGSDYLKVEPKKAQIPKDIKRKKKSLLARIVTERRSVKEGKKKGSGERSKRKSLFRQLDLHHIKKSLGKVGSVTMNKIRKITQKDSNENLAREDSEQSLSSTSLVSLSKGSQGARALPPIPMEDRRQQEYCDMDDDDFDGEQTYEEVEVSCRHEQPQSLMRPNMERVVTRAISLIDYRPGLRDPPDSLKLKKGQEVSVLENPSRGAWVKASVNGRQGCVMRSAIRISQNDELYEVDQGMTIEMDDIPEYSQYDDAGADLSRPDKFIVVHDWMPEQTGDLKVFEGDVVEVLEMNPNQWWRARNLDGSEGLVPSTYLQKQQPHQPNGDSSKHSGGSVSSVTSSHSSGDSVPAPPHLVKPKLSSIRGPSAAAGRQHQEPVSDDSGSSQDSGIGGSAVLSLASRLQGSLGSGMGVSSPSNKTFRTADTPKERQSCLIPSDKLPMKPALSTKPNKMLGPQIPVKRSSSLSTKPSQNPGPPLKEPKPTPSSKVPLVAPKPTSSKLTKVQSTNRNPSTVDNCKEKEKRYSLQSSIMYTCLWDYEASGPNDLTIRCGDTILVTDQTNSDWWIGTCGGKKGIFPANYVKKSEN